MKTLQFIISLCIASCAMIACDNRNNPEITDEKERQQMTEKAHELATFLTDNYNQGDSVYFTHTNIATNESYQEGFAVTLNNFRELVYIEEADVDESTDPKDIIQESIEIFLGYKLVTVLQSSETFLEIEFTHEKFNFTDITTDGWFIINHKYDISLCQMTEKGNEINISHNDTCCILQKNVGVVSFGDNNEKWELVR